MAVHASGAYASANCSDLRERIRLIATLPPTSDSHHGALNVSGHVGPWQPIKAATRTASLLAYIDFP